VRPATVDAAIAAVTPESVFLAGGTTLVDLMRLEVVRPATVIDIGGLPLTAIEQQAGKLRIGALASNADVAVHAAVKEHAPVLAEALIAGASPQVRNMATVSGNLLQRTRCPYFRDLGAKCNKREPGSGCAAIGGYSRSHAVLGTSDHCIATHPSDMCVALVALEAMVIVRGPNGERSIPIASFFVPPGARPQVESSLVQNELILAVEIPLGTLAASSRYLKVRDRAAFAFALAAAAAALEVRAGTIAQARLALGGVATVPWRAVTAEKALIGQPAKPESFERAAVIALEGARTTPHNAFKVELAKRAIVKALMRSAAGDAV
jgi:xanthine dehydrogenase YagS FAD-binding subunit